MVFKRPLSRSPTPPRIKNDTTETLLKDSPKSGVCRICGDKANIINYGTLSCQSCKTFFRRNGFRPEDGRPCNFNKICEVNMQTRHNCTACRLAKCFLMGMSSDFIRKEDYKKPKLPVQKQSDHNEQVASNQSTIESQVLTDGIFQDGEILLLESEQILLSNIVHAYDTFSTIPQMRLIIENLSISSSEIHINMISPLEIINQMCTSMQSFIGSSPDFQILTPSEQTSLFKRNLYAVTGFYSIAFFSQTGILHHPEYLQAFITIYGTDTMLSVRHVIQHLDSDSTIIKIILLIFAFSSNCHINNAGGPMERDSLLYGTFRLLGSQNVYTELLWKYMISQYGYNESALRLFRLLHMFICVVKHLAIAFTNNATHRTIVDDIFEKLKQTLATNTNEQVLLWGKDLVTGL